MSARSLEGALAAIGLDCEVEAHERLAVVVSRAGAGTLDVTSPELRRTALRLAGEHGFTHLALELVEAGGVRAPLPGD